ncbi:phosphoribosylamine-glycine ligase [Campylobacter pinnipediorum subsp. caledonicus]|uniref:Phosphoribosylamine--glycine ligase n=1 Tax=Campylobacter pinnipediorum subsp. caledonicus TaxID=1874362 RepID=A0A1S6U8K9_9BACT|nr:phosphoribosylamine--glycine ligase [Campylobacter pinnipediorum]AQW88078.1 phosphoribosylamine-glycine ligase [Campylobacter pinnipediorum subsp. caledonicus]OPA71521.1 phosphoribosylamine--glycine ligase [Campylobacter pinnipediorum subsp. caledonicus]
MKILIIGSGGREYSIALKLKEEKNIESIYFAPGNGATSRIGQNLDIKDYKDLAKFAQENEIDLTIVGPEAPLSDGVVDIFKTYNLNIFGPSKNAARLESSKAYMKDFLAKNNIKTAKYLNTDNKDEAYKFIDQLKTPLVVKADGLCAGKGVIICQDHQEAKNAVDDMLSGSSFGDAGKRVIIEEYLDGFELSFFAICDGKNFVSLPVAQDHKRLLDNDEGPNTGGMGAYAPSPLANKNLIKKIEEEVVKPTLVGMQNENEPFCGVLFVGVMVVENEPYVLEFNVRFGDPECEVLMPLIDENLSELLLDASKGKLKDIKLKDNYAVGVVIASEKYPYSSSKKEKIDVKQIPQNTHVIYAGVSEIDGELYADGGRVLVCVGYGKNINEAAKNAYLLCDNISFNGMQYRKDIAWQVLNER